MKKLLFILIVVLTLCACSKKEIDLDNIQNKTVTSLTTNVTYMLDSSEETTSGVSTIHENENDTYAYHTLVTKYDDVEEEYTYEEWINADSTLYRISNEVYEAVSVIDHYGITGYINPNYIDEITDNGSTISIKEEYSLEFLNDSGLNNYIFSDDVSFGPISIVLEDDKIVKESFVVFYTINGVAYTGEFELTFSDFNSSVLEDRPVVEELDEDYSYDPIIIEHDITLDDASKLIELGYNETSIEGQYEKDGVIVDVIYKWVIMNDNGKDYYYDWEYDNEYDDEQNFDETYYNKGKEIYESLYNALNK